MNGLQQIAPNANPETLEKITSFGYAIQSSAETPLTKMLPDFPCDNLKLISRISEANPSATPYQLIYRLYPFESFLAKECHGSLASLFDSLKIPTSKTESGSWIRSMRQSNTGHSKINSVERPTLSKTLLESNTKTNYHKGEHKKQIKSQKKST